jgi:hypothetical protein
MIKVAKCRATLIKNRSGLPEAITLVPASAVTESRQQAGSPSTTELV